MKLTCKVFTSLFIALAACVTTGRNAHAYNIPNFPACSNPTGAIIASYDSGIHGIVGSSATYTGSDSVYELDGGNVTQCFCSSDGVGIQTNWWKFGSLDQEEIQTLVNLDWVFVPDGSAWGLARTAYLAKNENFSCRGKTTTTTTASAPVCTAERPEAPKLISIDRSGSSATLTWTKVEKATHYVVAYGTSLGNYQYGVPNTGNTTNFTINSLDPNTQYYFVVYAVNDCMPSVASTTGGQVLGLASTGDAKIIVVLSIMGAMCLAISYYLKKTAQN